MFNNVKAKKRLTQCIIAFVVICMSLTGSFLLLEDSVDTVLAADRTVESQAQWDNVMTEAAAGGTWNVKLGKTIEFAGKLKAIPAGATVNLDMNNCHILWDVESTTFQSVIEDSYTSGKYYDGTFWGFVTNHGTLNITGTGTIRNKKVERSNNGDNRTWLVAKSATIVNTGNLIVGGGVTIESYLSYHDTSSTRKSAYVYNVAIYNEGGTVTSSGNITAGSLVAGPSGENPGQRYSFSYGIYDGVVNLKGGTISVDSYAGGTNGINVRWPDNRYKCHVYSAAVGVYSNTFTAFGNTTIKTITKNWETTDDNVVNIWEEGIDHMFSVGVMRKTNGSVPVIGPSVDIISTFEHLYQDEGGYVVYIPGTNLSISNCRSEDSGAADVSHIATPVTAVSSLNYNIGAHRGSGNEEKNYSNKFFGGTTPWESIGGGAEANRQYRTAQAYFAGDNDTVTAPQLNNDGSKNEHIRKTASIVNGAPGNDNTGSPVGDPGHGGSIAPGASAAMKKGSQYLVVYRYFRGYDDIESVSFRPESSRVNGSATVTVGNTATKNGIVEGDAKIAITSKPSPINDRFFAKDTPMHYETILSAGTATTDSITTRLNGIVSGVASNPALWSGQKNTLSENGVSVPTNVDNVIVVYIDYQIKAATPISVVASANEVNAGTTTTAFSVPYKGKALEPDKDFKIGIISTVSSNKELVTDRYNLTGTDASKVNVKYRYKVKGTNDWVENSNNFALPEDVGTYTIEVSVEADTTYSPASKNLQAKTQEIECTITSASVTISGPDSASGVYGNPYNVLIPINNYQITGVTPVKPEGVLTYSGLDANTVPSAGSSVVTLTWTPTPGTSSAKNYAVTTIPVQLDVAKKTVHVNAGVSSVTYGDSKPKYQIEYVEGLADCDKHLMTEYLNNSTFLVKNPSGEYVPYDVTTWAPEVSENGYAMQLGTFGGAGNENYTFIVNEKDGKLDVTKRNIEYFATAIDRTYDKDAGNTVDVVLKYLSGNLAGSDYYDVINTTGEMKDANAGNGKLVTVNTEGVVVANSKNYQLSINNASEVRVNIAKATPTGVKVVAYPDTVVYDSTVTLNAVALNVVESSVEGSWSWKQNDEGNIPTPTVDKSYYTAVFAPADKNNYMSLEQDVKLTVQQKEVKVSVKDPKTNEPYVISYGDPIPPISGSISYDGFTGNDNISNIGVNGRVDATTGYTRGSAAGKYVVNVVSELSSTNYFFTEVDTEITVAKKLLTITIAEQSVTFGDPVPELDVTDLRFDGFYGSENYTNLGGTAVVTTTYTPGASVDEYNVYATGFTSDNYEFNYVTGKLIVKKALLTVVPNDVKGVQYGADAPAYAENGLYTFVDASGHTVATTITSDRPVFSTQYKSGSDAGSYPVTVSVNAMTATNYEFVGQEGTLTVGKAVPVINEAAGAEVVNTHKFSEAVFDGTEDVVNPHNQAMKVEGKFAFVDADRVAAWGDRGFYDVVFIPDDTHNYENATGKTLLIILEKTVTGTPVIRGSAMVGSTLELVLDSMDPAVKDYYTIEWYKDNELVRTNGLEYTLKDEDKDAVFKVKLIPDTDHGFTDGGREIWTASTSAVIEALLETTAAQFKAFFSGVGYNNLGADNVFTSVEYDALRHPVTVEIADAYKTAVFADDYVVKYNGVASAPENAGTYIVTLDIGTPAKPAGGYAPNTYGPATGIVIGKLEITKATLNIDIDVPDKIYDGTTSVLNPIFTLNGKIDNVHDVWLTPGTKFIYDDPNAGQNKKVTVSNVGIIGDDAGNYQVNPEINVTANILPRTIYFEALNAEKDYDGTRNIAVTFRYSIEANKDNNFGYAAVDSASSVYPVNGMGSAEYADAGTWKIEKGSLSCLLAGSSAKNYVADFVYDEYEKITIKAIRPDVELPVIDGIIYNAARPLATYNSLLKAFDTDDGKWIFMEDTTVPTVNQKKYLARYNPNSDNYIAIEEYITVNVEPCEVEIYPEDTVITYGSKSPVIKILPEVLDDGTLLSEIGGSCTTIHDYYQGAPVTSEPYTVSLYNAFHDDNYKFITKTGTLTVIPAKLNVVAVAKDKVYDGTSDIEVNFAIVSGKYNNDDVSLSHSITIGQSMTPNAGQTTVDYISGTPSLVGSKSNNYEMVITPASRVLPVTINKADVAGVIFPAEASVEFGYDLRYAEFNGNTIGDGTFAFENAKDIIPSAVGFYEYKVVFTPTDSRNYNTQERVVTLEVVKCVLDYIVGVAGTPQEGETLAVVFTGLPAHAEPYVHYQWYRMNGDQYDPIPGATSAKYVATKDDIGCALAVVTYIDEAQAPFVYADGACEEGFGESDIRCIVGISDSAIKEITLTFWQRLLDWIRRIIAILTGIQLSGALGG